MPETPTDLVRRALLAINHGDEETFLDALHPSIEWDSHLDGMLPAGVWRGRQAVRDARRKAGAARATLHGLVERGDQVLVLGVVRAERQEGRAASTPIHWIWTVRDGLGVRVESFRSRTAAEAAFARAGGYGAGTASNEDDPKQLTK